MSDTDWLAKLQVGDEVMLTRPYPMLKTVEKFTKLHVIVGGEKYLRNTGRKAGELYGYIHQRDDDTLREWEEGRERNVISNRLRDIRWSEVSLETLRAIAALLPAERGEV